MEKEFRRPDHEGDAHFDKNLYEAEPNKSEEDKTKVIKGKFGSRKLAADAVKKAGLAKPEPEKKYFYEGHRLFEIFYDNLSLEDKKIFAAKSKAERDEMFQQWRDEQLNTDNKK